MIRPPAERFWEKVDKSSDCWEWCAKRNNRGYGMFMFGTKTKDGFKLAHRVAYEFAHGEIPKGKWVLHHCDNPGCVNPQHLFLGDNTANVRDMHRKGRGWGGIGPDTAYAILWERASGVPRKQIVAEHGVSMHVVKHVVNRRTWQSLSSLDHD